MRLTQRNAKAAVEIMKALSENKCTIADTPGIFSYVEMMIRSEAIVPRLDYELLLQKITSNLDD